MWRVIWAAEGVLGAEMSHFGHIDARARMCQNDLKCAARRWTSFLRLVTDSGFFLAGCKATTLLSRVVAVALNRFSSLRGAFST